MRLNRLVTAVSVLTTTLTIVGYYFVRGLSTSKSETSLPQKSTDAIKTRHDHGKTIFDKGRMHENLGEFEAAIQAYEEFAKMFPTVPQNDLRLGSCYFFLFQKSNQFKSKDYAEMHLRRYLELKKEQTPEDERRKARTMLERIVFGALSDQQQRVLAKIKGRLAEIEFSNIAPDRTPQESARDRISLHELLEELLSLEQQGRKPNELRTHPAFGHLRSKAYGLLNEGYLAYTSAKECLSAYNFEPDPVLKGELEVRMNSFKLAYDREAKKVKEAKGDAAYNTADYWRASARYEEALTHLPEDPVLIRKLEWAKRGRSETFLGTKSYPIKTSSVHAIAFTSTPINTAIKTQSKKQQPFAVYMTPNGINQWDLESGEIVFSLSFTSNLPDDISTIALSPDCSLALLGNAENWYVVETKSGTIKSSFRTTEGAIGKGHAVAAFSPDGKEIVIVSQWFWSDLLEGKCAKLYVELRSIAQEGGSHQLWCKNKDDFKFTDFRKVSSLAFSADGGAVAIGAVDEMWIVDAHSGRLRQCSGVSPIEFETIPKIFDPSPSARNNEHNFKAELKAFNDAHRRRASYRQSKGAFWFVKFQENGSKLVGYRGDGTVFVWDTETGKRTSVTKSIFEFGSDERNEILRQWPEANHVCSSHIGSHALSAGGAWLLLARQDDIVLFGLRPSCFKRP